MKKIVVVCLKYSYGDPKKGFSINHGSIIENLKKLNYDVYPVWIDEYKSDSIEDEILINLKNIKPSLIFFKIFKNEISVDFLKKLKENYFTFNWFSDDSWRFDNFSIKYLDSFSAIITTDHFAYAKYKNLNVKNLILSQHAGFKTNIDANIKYDYEVSFVGTKNKFRSWVIKYLNKKGIAVKCFGKGWSSKVLSYEQINKIYSKSKINLNIKNGISFDIRYLLFNPKSVFSLIKYFIKMKNIKVNDGIKARHFEVPLNNGFLINYYSPFLEDYYVIGQEMPCYSSIDELVDLVNYYLKNDLIRERIKLNMVKRANTDHTYFKRTKDFMLKIEKIYLKSQ